VDILSLNASSLPQFFSWLRQLGWLAVKKIGPAGGLVLDPMVVINQEIAVTPMG
jgi:hypothetical protein